MWNLCPLTRSWTHTPALQGRFLTTGLPGKSLQVILYLNIFKNAVWFGISFKSPYFKGAFSEYIWYSSYGLCFQVVLLSLIWVRLFATLLLCPWDSPGKSSGVGYHFLLQGIFLTQGLILPLPQWWPDIFFKLNNKWLISIQLPKL